MLEEFDWWPQFVILMITPPQVYNTGKTTGLPLPAYTEFRRAFPQARTFGSGASTHPASVLDEAMQACDAVIVSNPHNPTGQIIGRADLVRAENLVHGSDQQSCSPAVRP